jgi:putative hemolysin
MGQLETPSGNDVAQQARPPRHAVAVGRQFPTPGNPVERTPPATVVDRPVSGRLGSLEVKLAGSPAEIRRAQALRYRVFFEEMSARGDLRTHSLRRDADRFDRVCDHLLVLDHAASNRSLIGRRPRVVGTYRLLRDDTARLNGGSYTEGEFDITPLIRRKPSLRFLELGRSCVFQPYRNKRTVELLWHGVWSYVLAHGMDVMIGCASLEGADPDRLALQLSFLHHHARAPEEWRVRAYDHFYVEMNRLPRSAIDARRALRSLPPLVKGYLRLGAFVGDGAVIDRQFGTTDVCIVLPVSAIRSRYVNYYGTDASRFALKPRVLPRGAPLSVA